MQMLKNIRFNLFYLSVTKIIASNDRIIVNNGSWRTWKNSGHDLI
jgi:hypothetical protein